jgi:hypothetical protein
MHHAMLLPQVRLGRQRYPVPSTLRSLLLIINLGQCPGEAVKLDIIGEIPVSSSYIHC